MNPRFCILWLSILSTVGSLVAQPGYEIVSPNDLQSVDGNSGTYFPWGTYPIRYQQVYDASQFQQLANVGGGWIRNFSYRLDGNDIGDFSRTITGVEITLSTTQRHPDALSAVFAENAGLDAALVFSGTLNLRMDRPYPQGSAQPFGSHIFITPFFYNPNQGNLLMDIRIFSQSPITLPSDLDSSREFDDSVSRVFGAINASSGTIVDTEGLVTSFFVEPIPEPSIAALFAVGVGGGLLVRCWRKRR